MKQFDDTFSKKAREAFESYNADHLADAGWDSFAAKQGKKKLLAFVIPLWAKAASVAVLLTVGSLFTYRTIERENGVTAVQTTQVSPAEATAPSRAEQLMTTQTPALAEASHVKNPIIGIDKPSVFEAEERTVLAAEVIPVLTGSDATEKAELIEGLNIAENSIAGWQADATEEELLGKSEEVLFLPYDDPVTKRKTTLMTGLSGMMASVENATSASGGVSFGFYVEQQITRRISVRPGVALAIHNYGLASSSGENMALDYSTPDLAGLSGTTSSYEASIEAITMEVPLNVVFSIWKRSGSSLFVSTGVSTLIYLSQNMSGSFDNTYTRSTVNSTTGELTYESKTTTVVTESKEEPFGHVDLFGLANFSAGYSLPFGKTNILLFEPFVQLPVSDISSMNLRIRYGGLSMKVKF